MFMISSNSFAAILNEPTAVYKKQGPCYIIELPGKGKAMLAMITETRNEGIFNYLVQIDLQTGKLIRKRSIETGNKPVTAENVIEKMGSELWLYTDSLRAYDILSLETRITETMIATANPLMKDNFSTYVNAYLLDEATNVLYITAADGSRHKLYAGKLVLKPDNTNSEAFDEEGYSYEYAAEYKLHDRYQLKYALGNVSLYNNKVYILGTEKETGNVISYYGSGIYAENPGMRSLSIYNISDNKEKVAVGGRLLFTSRRKYANAGFLKKKFFERVWQGNTGEHLLIFESNIKMNPTLSVAKTDSTGAELWLTDTGLPMTAFTDYLITEDGNLVLWFELPVKEKGIVQSAAVIIQKGKKLLVDWR
jgi:hypothetical protein